MSPPMSPLMSPIDLAEFMRFSSLILIPIIGHLAWQTLGWARRQDYHARKLQLLYVRTPPLLNIVAGLLFLGLGTLNGIFLAETGAVALGQGTLVCFVSGGFTLTMGIWGELRADVHKKTRRPP